MEGRESPEDEVWDEIWPSWALWLRLDRAGEQEPALGARSPLWIWWCGYQRGRKRLQCAAGGIWLPGSESLWKESRGRECSQRRAAKPYKGALHGSLALRGLSSPCTFLPDTTWPWHGRRGCGAAWLGSGPKHCANAFVVFLPESSALESKPQGSCPAEDAAVMGSAACVPEGSQEPPLTQLHPGICHRLHANPLGGEGWITWPGLQTGASRGARAGPSCLDLG